MCGAIHGEEEEEDDDDDDDDDDEGASLRGGSKGAIAPFEDCRQPTDSQTLGTKQRQSALLLRLPAALAPALLLLQLRAHTEWTATTFAAPCETWKIMLT